MHKQVAALLLQQHATAAASDESVSDSRAFVNGIKPARGRTCDERKMHARVKGALLLPAVPVGAKRHFCDRALQHGAPAKVDLNRRAVSLVAAVHVRHCNASANNDQNSARSSARAITHETRRTCSGSGSRSRWSQRQLPHRWHQELSRHDELGACLQTQAPTASWRAWRRILAL